MIQAPSYTSSCRNLFSLTVISSTLLLSLIGQPTQTAYAGNNTIDARSQGPLLTSPVLAAVAPAPVVVADPMPVAIRHWMPHQIPAGLSRADWASIQNQVDLTFHAAVKASNAGPNDQFGYSVAISGDTMVVGAPIEDSSSTGVDGEQSNDNAPHSGAAFVFVRNGTTWSQQAYLKASNTGQGDNFGWSVAIYSDTIVVGAPLEDSAANVVNGNQGDDLATTESGAAYVFVRNGISWNQQAYLKAFNPGHNDNFGWSVSISADTIVVGAENEDSNATGVDGDGTNNAANRAGAAYVFQRTNSEWTQQAYLKASNTDALDYFGSSVAVSGDTIVVGAPFEDSNSNGVNGNQSNNNLLDAGAAYVFVRAGVNWSQQAYLKESNTGIVDNDNFGNAVAIAGDTIVVGAHHEDSNATGIDGNQNNDSANRAGAAYVFQRTNSEWTQQAYLKASNTDIQDYFATSVAIADAPVGGAIDKVVVVGAPFEDSNATGLDGDRTNNTATESGAAYVFVRSDGSVWNQKYYMKASASHISDTFGMAVAVAGETVVVGAPLEDTSAANSGSAYVYGPAPLVDAQDDEYSADSGRTIIAPSSFGVLSNDTTNVAPLTALVLTQPSTGTLLFDSNGAFTYQAPPGLNDYITFTYQAKSAVAPLAVGEATVGLLIGNVPRPVNISLSSRAINENLPKGSIVGALSTVDTSSISHTYAIVGGADAKDFAIVGNQLLSNAVFNFEAGQSPEREVKVRSTNSSKLTVEKNFIIKIQNEEPEPAGPPDQCDGGKDLQLYASDDGDNAAFVRNTIISDKTVLGCGVTGDLNVRFQGQTIFTQAITGTVNRWNKLSIGNGTLPDFEFGMVGNTVKAHKVSFFNQNKDLVIHLREAQICAPAEWGGDCIDGTSNHLQLDRTGLAAAVGSVPMPDFVVNQAPTNAAELARFNRSGSSSTILSLLKLSAKETGKGNAKNLLKGALFKKVDGGYEIAVELALSLPKVPVEKGCFIKVGVTLFKDAAGVVTMRVKSVNPQMPQRPDGLHFREARLGLECEFGIPIDATGLQVSGVEGTIALQPDEQFVQLALTITPEGGLRSVLEMQATATLFWKPEWGFDLEGSAKLFKVFEAGGFKASIRKDRLSFTAYVNAVVIKGNVEFYAWWPDGRFHFSGGGTVELGIPEGSIWEKCVKFIGCVSIPPFDASLGSVQVQGGEFTNGQYGFKGFASFSGHDFGFFASSSGFKIGGVSDYTIAKPPAIMRKSLAAGPSNITVMTVNAVLNPSDVISQVVIAKPSDTMFVVSSPQSLTVTLANPLGQEINPNNVATFNATYTATDHVTYTQYLYQVPAASIGNWQVVITGDTTSTEPVISILSLANNPTFSSATLGAANDPSRVAVDWALTSDAPATVTIYANGGSITSSVVVTDIGNLTHTEEISNFTGSPLTTVAVSDFAKLQSAQMQRLVDLTGLPSGNYALWLSMDNGFLPSVNKYVTLPNSSDVPRVTVDNKASLPNIWTAALTPTIDTETGQIVVLANALRNADIDSYGFNISTVPNRPERTVLGGFAQIKRDADGNPIGTPYVRFTVDDVKPNETYYVSLIAYDEDSDWSVQSQEISITVPLGDFEVNTSKPHYRVDAGTQMTIPANLKILQPLFYPQVYTELDTAELPRGLDVLFADDSLSTSLNQDDLTKELAISVDKYMPNGVYTFTLRSFQGAAYKEYPVGIYVGLEPPETAVNGLTGTLHVQFGDIVTYTLVVSNSNSTQTLHAVSISGSVPANSSILSTNGVSTTTGGDYGRGYASRGPVDLVPSEEITLVWTVQPSQRTGDLVTKGHATGVDAGLELNMDVRVYRINLGSLFRN